MQSVSGDRRTNYQHNSQSYAERLQYTAAINVMVSTVKTVNTKRCITP
jgi:hypothetical protein